MTDPKKNYSMEFVLESEQTANDLRKLIGSFVDLSAKITIRKDSYVVYLKRAAYVRDMLGIMGADDAVLELAAIMINKEILGDAQRLSNCDNANVDRTVAASEEQLGWIKIIDDAEGLDRLPPPLRDVAMLRLERPEASLSEIGEALAPPIRKPGVSKRFAKIKAIAEEIGKKQNGKESNN